MRENINHSRRKMLKTAGGLTLGGLAAGCLGQQDDGGDGGDGGASPTGGSKSRFEMRDSELVQKAQDEGKVNVRSVISGLEPLWNEFEFENEVVATYNRRTGDDLYAKIIQEYQANKVSMDILHGGGRAAKSKRLIDDGILQTGLPDDLAADLDREYMPASKKGAIPTFVQRSLRPVYNTEMVSNPPETFDEMFEVFDKGEIGVDVRDNQLIIAMYEMDYYDNKEQVHDKIRKLGEYATWRSSHYTSGQQVAQGSIPVAITYAKYVNYDFGQTLGFVEPEGFPLLAGKDFVSMATDMPHPHAGLLALKYLVNNVVDVYKGIAGEDIILSPKAADEQGIIDVTTFETVDKYDFAAIDDLWAELTGYESA